MKAGEFFQRAIRYLPNPLTRRRSTVVEFPGPFAEQVLDRLRAEHLSDPSNRKTLYVRIKVVEWGRQPTSEDFRIGFQLVDAPSSLGFGDFPVTEDPIGVTERISSEGLPGGGRVVLPSDLFFHFTEAQGLAKNMERFRHFALERVSSAAIRQGDRIPMPVHKEILGQVNPTSAEVSPIENAR